MQRDANDKLASTELRDSHPFSWILNTRLVNTKIKIAFCLIQLAFNNIALSWKN